MLPGSKKCMISTNLNFHALSAKETIASLESSETGLSSGEAQIRLKAFGEHVLTQEKTVTPIEIFANQFKNFLVILLIVAAIISFALGEVVDAAFILFIIILNAVFGFVQEYKAEQALQALKKMTAPQATVLRDAMENKIDTRFLVPGDVVLFSSGDRVPADCRLIESYSLGANESTLTGESAPVNKDTALLLPLEQPLAERANCVYFGTVITRGRAKAIIISTGMSTEFGKIAKLVQEVKTERTPLEEKLELLGKQLGIAAIAICLAIFAIGVATGLGLVNMFFTSVSLLVAAVPEGLPAVVTITLALGVQRMVKKNSLIRKLPAVETLGSTTVICSDKTGTLTRNEMTARILYFNGTENKIQEGIPLEASARRPLEISTLCNNATLTSGDPTERALIEMAQKGSVTKEELETQYQFVSELSFDPSRKMMSTIYLSKKGELIAFAKGAPEVILNKSKTILTAAGEKPLDEFEIKKITAKNEELASNAMRVLALAYRTLRPGTEITSREVEKELTFVGLVGIIDPPRLEARGAVELCKKAGIKVVMITGDNGRTAGAIAKELGIIDGGKIILGSEIDATSDKDLLEIVKETRVYARATPTHKLRIVDALKKNGEIVAMTGDGVNDAPALKKADIGIAMGKSGTEVAREASSMVLLDDNFATIVNAIEEGRKIYDNIAKSIRYLVSCNIGEIAVILTATLAHWTILVPVQILWMNLVTDGPPALALGVDPGDNAAMSQPPRKPSEEVLGIKNAPRIAAVAILITVATVGTFIYARQWGDGVAISMAFATIVIAELLYALSIRSQSLPLHKVGIFDNGLLVASVLIGTVIQVIITQEPYFNVIFDTVPLTSGQWLFVIGAAAITPLAVEAYKIVTSYINSDT